MLGFALGLGMIIFRNLTRVIDNITKLLQGLADQQKTGAEVDKKVLEKIKTEVASVVKKPVKPEKEEVTEITLRNDLAI